MPSELLLLLVVVVVVTVVVVVQSVRLCDLSCAIAKVAFGSAGDAAFSTTTSGEALDLRHSDGVCWGCFRSASESTFTCGHTKHVNFSIYFFVRGWVILSTELSTVTNFALFDIARVIVLRFNDTGAHQIILDLSTLFRESKLEWQCC